MLVVKTKTYCKEVQFNILLLHWLLVSCFVLLYLESDRNYKICISSETTTFAYAHKLTFKA